MTMEIGTSSPRLSTLDIANQVLIDNGYEPATPSDDRVQDGSVNWPRGIPMSPFPCAECGKKTFPIAGGLASIKKQVEQRACATCCHWLHLLNYQGVQAIVRVGGIHYMYDSRLPWVEGVKVGLAFGGRVFNIKFLVADQIVKTNNLWYQGEIPACFRERMPDNAVFVKVDDV